MMTNWTFHTIDTNGIQMHYRRSGGDKPPFILAHGFSDDGGCWPLVADALVDRYDVIALDARGHGKSSDPSEGYGSAEYAADYAGLIIGLGLVKPILLGHSMGAINALAMAALYPELPGKILLEDPPPFWHPFVNDPVAGDNEVKRRAGTRSWMVGVKRKLHAEIVADVKRNHPAWDEAEFMPWAESKQRFSMNVLNGGGASLDWGVLLPKVTCPALLLTADPALGAILSDAHVASLKQLVPHMRVQHIPNAGHSIRREQFAVYMAAVNGFIKP